MMSSLKTINAGSSAVLILDYQRMLVENYSPEPRAHLEKTSHFLNGMRAAGLPVIYVTVGFRPGYPEVSANNKMFSAVKAGERFRMGDAASQVPDEIAPRDGEVVVVKHRVSAFCGTDLKMVLRAMQIDTLVLFGIATTGVVLSTVRAAADLDYKLIVIRDLCLDIDQPAHSLLLDNIFPRQAHVTDTKSFLA